MNRKKFLIIKMPVILERGKNYDFLSKLDARYALRLADLFDRKFSTLEEMINLVEKIGLNGTRFYAPDKANLGLTLKECSVFYQLKNTGIEAARIRVSD